MTDKNKKQFGIWMDSNQAIIIGKGNQVAGEFIILANTKSARSQGNSNENSLNNSEKVKRQTSYKELATHMQNIDEVPVTGTGQVQEQFSRFMAETPQYKNGIANHSTTKKMS